MKTSNFTQQAKSEGRQYTNRGDTSLDKFNSSNGQVYGTLTLDTRRKLDSGLYPAAVRVAYDGKNIYLRIGKHFTLEDWTDLCECEKQARNKRAAERKELKGQMDKVIAMVNQLVEDNNFSLAKLKLMFQGRPDKENTIYSVWEHFIREKREGGKAGTARCSEDIKKRFKRDMGMNVTLADIGRPLILDWVKVMKKNGLSTTSIGISLRTFRTIVNICIDQKLVSGNTKDMFKDTGYNKVCSRKHEFLDVETMRRLYDFWEKGEAKDENGKELFFPKEKHAIFRDLGLFLFMYLGDGQNLADTLRLTYDGMYTASKGKQLHFLRHKTMDRNESASEVIFPVTPELQKIIDKYGNKPEQGKRVFPIMNELITPDKEVWVIQRYNRYIREHMEKVAELLGMEQRPSATWARHSFATNLNNSGMVPYKYISDSMGHSGSGDITANYIGAYPLETMLEYNWYLLHDKKEKTPQQPSADKQVLRDMLKNLSKDELDALLSSL